uniref:Uncharacterized protein n=1 Tax=Glossina brevipalpis TaxID=37001 RepID=A0A1A9WUX1_9MUSC
MSDIHTTRKLSSAKTIIDAFRNRTPILKLPNNSAVTISLLVSLVGTHAIFQFFIFTNTLADDSLFPFSRHERKRENYDRVFSRTEAPPHLVQIARPILYSKKFTSNNTTKHVVAFNLDTCTHRLMLAEILRT